MREEQKEYLLSKIDHARVISFDVFDTLIFRKVNTPETIFDLVGKHFGIHGFRKIRVDAQNEAGRRVYERFQYPHANMDDIYEVLSEYTEYGLDWNQVKLYEIEMERDALTVNEEMHQIYEYALKQKKRVIAASDMYLPADILCEFLKVCGYQKFDFIYCSADEHKAKFNKELFSHVIERENIAAEEILHIGDKQRDDVEYPSEFGMQTFLYEKHSERSKLNGAPSTEIDNGLYNILYHENNDFWYNLGLEVGGPLYCGLYLWLEKKIREENKKVFFLSRDGYHLYRLFRNKGYESIEYMYTSRRALLLAGITELNEEDILELPPFTKGQTVDEILEYLCVSKNRIQDLKEVGFSDFHEVIRTEEDVEKIRELYRRNKNLILERCETERKNAISYFDRIGFWDEEAVIFDCGWNGTSQYYLERFKKATGCRKKDKFYYFGIRNTEKSRRQLSGCHFEAYLFDMNRNHALQAGVNEAVVLYELFFSAPHESVFYYGNRDIIFEEGRGEKRNEQIFRGIDDFLALGLDFAKKYEIDYSPELAIGHLQRLILQPTEEEAERIGNVDNVDGFARQIGMKKKIAFITENQLKNNPHSEVYWVKGLLKRNDISEKVKRIVAQRSGIQYPLLETNDYHLEDKLSVDHYRRWMLRQEKEVAEQQQLQYKPLFSIVIPVYNTVEEQLTEAIESVLNQTYDNFELILVDDHSTWECVRTVLAKYEQREKVHIIYRPVNGHISTATNDGIEIARGEFLVNMDCDDLIDANALYEIAYMLNQNPDLDFIYSDEDKITEDGKIRHLPFFKPDWSPDLFLCMNYTNHLSAYRMEIVKRVGGLRTAYNGAQDYDFVFRFMEYSDNRRVGHIAKVLYHWRERKESVSYEMGAKNYAVLASRDAKEAYLRRNHMDAHLEYVPGTFQYRTVYHVVGKPLISIIIPSKDHFEILKQCIESIKNFTLYENYEIIVVDNGSEENHRLRISEYLEKEHIQYIYDIYEFNFSRMCNIGVRYAHGEYYLFLNDDIEVIQYDWLERMLGHVQQKHVGIVGGKLLYPCKDMIQHAGIVNAKEGPGHSYLGSSDENSGYFSMKWLDSNCIAVTGACLLIDASLFEMVGGFSETLPIAYNDIDLCFKVHENGYYIVFRADVVLYHHESLSRGIDDETEEKKQRLCSERMRLYLQHQEMTGKDPFLNPNLYQYDTILRLNNNYDILEKIELNGFEGDMKIMLDQIVVTDTMKILGWSFLPNRTDNDQLKRYLIFQDPFGAIYRCPVMDIQRADVMETFERKQDILFCGFECILQKDVLRMDLMQYKIGLQAAAPDGESIYCWCEKRTDLRYDAKHELPCVTWKVVSDYKPKETTRQVNWSLESVTEFEEEIVLRGFAFYNGNDHIQYEKSIVLWDGESAICFELQQEERLDVAVAHPAIHFLTKTGFQCTIRKELLEVKRGYDILLHFQNLLDSNDTCDVLMKEKQVFIS